VRNNNYSFSTLLLCLLAFASAAFAQDAGNAAQAGAPPAAMEPAARSNFVVTGVSVSSTFDDNIFNAAGNNSRTLDELVSINPRFQLQIDRPRTGWLFNYAPSVSFSQNAPQFSTNSEFLNSTFNHKFTPRWSASLFSLFSITTTGADQFLANGGDANIALAQRPNDSLVVTGVRRQQSVSGGDVAYALDKHSHLSVGGSYTSSSFNQGGVATNLIDSTIFDGHIGYSHQRSRVHTYGVEYSASKLSSNGGTFDVLSHTASVTSNFALSKTQSLAVFAGPEISQTSGAFPFTGIAIDSQSISWTAGGTYTLLAGKNRVDVNAVRQVSDGAGVAPAVRLTTAGVTVVHPFARTWIVSASGQYNLNDPLVSGTAQKRYQFWSGETGLTRKFRSGMSISLAYWRTQQNGITGVLPAGNVNHNRAIVTVAYDLMHPLGK
jgi:hypothetical protein